MADPRPTTPPPPRARGGNATPVPVPKRKPKPRTTTPLPPRGTNTPPPSGATPSPYPSYAFPKIYNPASIAAQAQAAAERAVQAQIGALPTVEQQSAPYQQQIASEQGLGQSLLDALKGAQTYRVDLATGVPQAFSAQAAATGGDQDTAHRAAATLASYGTSAANQIAQQEATAPAATAANTRIIQQRLENLLSGPTGHDALARQVEAQRPNLENAYTSTFGQQAQIPFNEALQLATANTNYDLAQQTYGLNQTQAANAAAYQRGQLDIGRTNAQTSRINAQLRQLGLQLQSARDKNAYKTAQARLRVQQANATRAGNTADARAAQQAQAALTRAQQQIISQANTLYKRTSGKPGSEGTTVLHYTTIGPPPTYTLTPHSETVPSSQADKRYQDLIHSGFKNVTRTQGAPADPGSQRQSAGYLRDQAVKYAVTVLQTQAPWLPPAAQTRLAQQIVAGVFGTASANTQNSPPSGYPRGHTYPAGP